MGCHSNGAIFAVSSEIVVKTAYRNNNPRPGYADEVQYSQKCIRGEKRDLRYPCETGELASQHCPQLSPLARQYFHGTNAHGRIRPHYWHSVRVFANGYVYSKDVEVDCLALSSGPWSVYFPSLPGIETKPETSDNKQSYDDWNRGKGLL